MLPFDLNELKHVRWHRYGPHEPYRIDHAPDGWHVLGTGNYAVVFFHESDPDWVVKMRLFAPEDEEIVIREFQEERDVYERIGRHHSFSELRHAQFPFLVLKRLHGITLYTALIQGTRIPPIVIDDINEGLQYARSRGLHPHDVHIKNVIMYNGRGYVADISDFLKTDYCRLWDDCMVFYRFIYRPFIYPFGLAIPYQWLQTMKSWYRKRVPYGSRED
jgi:hypothetical protein